MIASGLALKQHSRSDELAEYIIKNKKEVAGD